jgi:IclR family acetate operon transcriptional repressor
VGGGSWKIGAGSIEENSMAGRATGSKGTARGGAPARSVQVQSLVRSLALLNGLGAAAEGLTLTEISQQVGLSPSTAHRLLTTLEQERYVQFNAERRLWVVGVQAFTTGNAFLKTRSIAALAPAPMRALMEETEETVNLAIVDRDEAIYLAQVECRQMMRAFARPGGRVPLHCSGVGKALLSAMSDAEVGRVLVRCGLPRMTVKTINDPAGLRADIAAARVRGYAIDDEEHAVGLRCIAAVIYDEHAGAVAAISVSGPMARITDARIAHLGRQVKARADAITALYGGISP